MVGFENYMAEMIITTKQCVECKNHVARSKVKVTVALKICALQNSVRPLLLTLYYMVGFENYFAQQYNVSYAITTGVPKNVDLF